MQQCGQSVGINFLASLDVISIRLGRYVLTTRCGASASDVTDASHFASALERDVVTSAETTTSLKLSDDVDART